MYKSVDQLQEHQQLMFRLILLHRNLENASDCADGLRSVRSVKYELPIYSRTNKVKYLIACIQLHTLIQSRLTEQKAYRLTWNRTVNISGGPLSNEPIDGWVELINREVKYMCKGNQTKDSCIRHAAAFKVEMSMIDQFDKILQHSKTKGFHKDASRQADVQTIVKELARHEALEVRPGRKLNSRKLANVSSELSLVQSNLNDMITRHKFRISNVHVC